MNNNVANTLYHSNLHCSGPKHEEGNRDSSLFLFFLLPVMRFPKLNKPPSLLRPPLNVPEINNLPVVGAPGGGGGLIEDLW